MPFETDLSQTTTTTMDTNVDSFTVGREIVDEQASVKETFWENPDWPENLGYYNNIPELQQAIKSLAIWTVGKGWETDRTAENIIGNITGWGEDSFQTILQNMLIVKKINGDSYAEIVRNDNGTLLNLKPLNPSRIRHVVNSKGLIIRYEEIDPSSKAAKRTFKPSEIFHLSNDRIANEIHGTSVVKACKWVIDARNEAMNDWRRMSHRSTMRVMYIDADNSTLLSQVRTQWETAINKGEVLILPSKKGQDIEVVDYEVPPVQPFLDWIRYLENFFYQAVGVPKIILGGSQDFTEASSKIGYLTFEQVYAREQRELESDIWNQLAIRLTFNRPTSLKDPIQQSEAANTGQVSVQQNELNPTVQRTE